MEPVAKWAGVVANDAIKLKETETQKGMRRSKTKDLQTDVKIVSLLLDS